MILNLMIILAILVGGVYIGKKTYDNLMDGDYSDNEVVEEEDASLSLHDFEDLMVENFSKYLRANLKEENYSEAQYRQKEREHTRFSEALSSASYGDADAKRVVISHIKGLLNSSRLNYDEEDLNRMIPFDNDDKLKIYDKWQIIAYLYIKKHKKHWLSQLISDYHLDDAVPMKEGGKDCFFYWVSSEKMEEVYQFLAKVAREKRPKGSKFDNSLNLTWDDKVEIIAQRAFEEKYGLGVIDLIIDSDVDEVDGGVAGRGFDAFYIMYHGKQIKFDFLSCGSEEEMARITDNVYKYDAPYVMSRSDAKIVAKMKNGARVTAAQPPFSENYEFWIRLFESAGPLNITKLLCDQNHEPLKNADIFIEMFAFLIKGHQTGGITGGMGTGKTTLLKAVMQFIDPQYSIGIAEKQAELNAREIYPNRNITAFQETDTIGTQDALDFLKKCNRQVNIIGEVAEAIQAYFVIQTSGIASYFTLFTSHHDTTKKLVEGVAGNIMSVGQAASMTEAITSTIGAINFDCHIVLEHAKGYRHPERITEIIPVEKDASYPSESMKDAHSEEALTLDTQEYYKRSTNPDLYTTSDMVVFENDAFYLANRPSEAMMKRMRRVLNDEDYERFTAKIEEWYARSASYRAAHKEEKSA